MRRRILSCLLPLAVFSFATAFDGIEMTPKRTKAIHEALERIGIQNIYYESPNTAHEWQSWRITL